MELSAPPDMQSKPLAIDLMPMWRGFESQTEFKLSFEIIHYSDFINTRTILALAGVQNKAKKKKNNFLLKNKIMIIIEQNLLVKKSILIDLPTSISTTYLSYFIVKCLLFYNF